MVVAISTRYNLSKLYVYVFKGNNLLFLMGR